MINILLSASTAYTCETNTKHTGVICKVVLNAQRCIKIKICQPKVNSPTC